LQQPSFQQQALDQVQSTEVQNQAIRSSQLAASSGQVNAGGTAKEQEILRQQQVQYLRDSELQKRYQGYFGISALAGGGAGAAAPGSQGGMVQQNMLSDSDISAAMFNAISNGGGQGTQNNRMDGGEQADSNANPAGPHIQINQMIPGRRSLLVSNNNSSTSSAFSFADTTVAAAGANAANNRASQMQNPLTSQQIQMLQK